MSEIAPSLVGKLLEDGEQLNPEREELHRPEDADKWEGAYKTFDELWALKQKQMELFRELGASIAYRRALHKVGLVPGQVKNVLRAEDIYETTPITPGHPLKAIRFSYAKRYPNALVGVVTKDDRHVYFQDPVPRQYGEQAPTYAEFNAKRQAAREQAAGY